MELVSYLVIVFIYQRLRQTGHVAGLEIVFGREREREIRRNGSYGDKL